MRGCSILKITQCVNLITRAMYIRVNYFAWTYTISTYVISIFIGFSFKTIFVPSRMFSTMWQSFINYNGFNCYKFSIWERYKILLLKITTNVPINVLSDRFRWKSYEYGLECVNEYILIISHLNHVQSASQLPLWIHLLCEWIEVLL